MSQTIRQMRAIAAGMGITFHELVRRRFQRESRNYEAVEQDGVIRIKPRGYCKADLPDNWTPRYRTASP